MATRFYFYPSSSSLTPTAAFGSGWTVTNTATRNTLYTYKGFSASDATAQNGGNDQVFASILRAQFVSDKLEAQTISAQTVKAQFQMNEANILNNNYLHIGIRLVDIRGVHKADILAVTSDDVEAVLTTSTNRQFSATTTEVTAAQNDRIIVEVGFGGTNEAGGSHTGTVVISMQAGLGDLPENDTDTTSNLNSWVEFSNTLLFDPPVNMIKTSMRPASFSPGIGR